VKKGSRKHFKEAMQVKTSTEVLTLLGIPTMCQSKKYITITHCGKAFKEALPYAFVTGT